MLDASSTSIRPTIATTFTDNCDYQNRIPGPESFLWFAKKWILNGRGQLACLSPLTATGEAPDDDKEHEVPE